jgi:hypothetical protein
MQDCWLPRLSLGAQVIVFIGLLIAACLGKGNGTVIGLLAGASGMLIGTHTTTLIAGTGTKDQSNGETTP